MRDGRSALLVLDMQVDFGGQEGVYERAGGLSGAGIRVLVPTIARVMEAARESGIRSVASRFTILTDPFGRPINLGHVGELRPFLREDGFRVGTAGHALLPGLPRPDFEVQKTRFSAFYGTPLEQILRGLGAEHLVVCGIATNGAVEGTVRDAVMRDFSATVLEDCCTAYRRENHEASLVNLRGMAEVSSAEEWLERVGRRRG